MLRKITAYLLIVCSLFVLCGCQKDTQQAPVETAYNFEKTIRPVGMNALFGKVLLNTDPQYVSEGEQSLQLIPSGTYADQLYVYFPFESSTLVINYMDLNYLSNVYVDVYASDAMNLGVGFYFSQKADLRAEPQYFSLQQGWNELVVPVQHALLALQYELTGCYGAYVQLEYSAVENKQCVWLDNIRVEKRSEPVEVEQNIILDEWDGYCELADFEHAYQQLLATPYTIYNNAQLPSVKVVKAADYGFEAASGEKVLRLETYPAVSYGTGGTSWTQLAFSDKWLEALDITRFNPDEYELKFNVYQQGDISTLLELNLYHGYNGMDWAGITSKKDCWVEYSAPLSKFSNFCSKPSQLVFAWMDWDPMLGDSCVFYIDNIRIERISQ